MDTLPRNYPASFLIKDKATYLAVKEAWKKGHTKPSPGGYQAAWHLIYSALRGRDYRKAFSPLTSEDKIKSGGWTEWGLVRAMDDLQKYRSLRMWVNHYGEKAREAQPTDWFKTSHRNHYRGITDEKITENWVAMQLRIQANYQAQLQTYLEDIGAPFGGYLTEEKLSELVELLPKEKCTYGKHTQKEYPFHYYYPIYSFGDTAYVIPDGLIVAEVLR